MKRLLVPALLLNAVLLAGRFWQEMPAHAARAPGGGRGGPALCGDLDRNGKVDVSDAIGLLAYLFNGGAPPVACALEGDLGQDEVDLLRRVLSHLSVVQLDDGKGGKAETVRFSGVNLQIVNGLGSTSGSPDDPQGIAGTAVNGLGNLIVGYQESCAIDGSASDDRTGSHNLIVGACHAYSSFGGLVAGYRNTVSAPYASVTGGYENVASGESSSVTGGGFNTASARGCSVTGGGRNVAGLEEEDEEGYSTVTGGFGNAALGSYNVVLGGSSNEALEYYSLVGGGFYNVASEYGACVLAGSNNTASGDFACVSGGIANTASGEASTVSGGGGLLEDLKGGNTASGALSTVSGGSGNLASGQSACVSGGISNTASGDGASVSGGGASLEEPESGNAASGVLSSVSGGFNNSAVGDFSSVSGGLRHLAVEDFTWSAGALYQKH